MGGRQPAAPPGAAAADYLADLLRGPERSGVVVAVRSHAALAAIGTGPDARMIAVTSDGRATRTANTLLLTEVGVPAVGECVVAGDGGLLLGGRRHRVLRYWRSGIPTHPIDPAAASMELTSGTGLDAATVRPLLLALASGTGVAAAARALVGRGPGSTPAGDDVLAGVALALRIAGRPALLAQVQAATTPDLHDRTTALSADLLRAALAGHASTEVRTFVQTLRPGADADFRRRAVAAVLGLGHTSGADLVQGLVGTLRAVLPGSSSCPPRTTTMLPTQSIRMATR